MPQQGELEGDFNHGTLQGAFFCALQGVYSMFGVRKKEMTRDSRFLFWWRWLVIATCIVLLFGLSMVVLPGSTQTLFNFVYLSSPHGAPIFSESAINYIKFISAVLGSVMFGWSIALLYILFGSFRRRQMEGWKTIAASLVAWCIPDTALSLWYGFSQNAVLNLIMLGLFVIPLIATYRIIKETPNQGVQGTPAGAGAPDA